MGWSVYCAPLLLPVDQLTAMSKQRQQWTFIWHWLSLSFHLMVIMLFRFLLCSIVCFLLLMIIHPLKRHIEPLMNDKNKQCTNYLMACMCVHFSICLTIHPSNQPTRYPSIHPSIFLSIHLPIQPTRHSYNMISHNYFLFSLSNLFPLL